MFEFQVSISETRTRRLENTEEFSAEFLQNFFGPLNRKKMSFSFTKNKIRMEVKFVAVYTIKASREVEA